MDQIVSAMDADHRGGDALLVEYVRAHNRGSCRRCRHRFWAAGCAARTMSLRLERFQQMAADVSARTGEQNEILGCIQKPILYLPLNRHRILSSRLARCGDYSVIRCGPR